MRAPSSPASTVTRLAPAKLNLTLAVIGKRADGYHLLDSLVAFTALGDKVAVRKADSLTLAFEGPFAGILQNEDRETNLVIRAARLLAEAAGIDAAAEITLTKNLPVASGIGGGSSDAAAALLALIELWDLAIDQPSLHRIGLRLGADVPVCLMGRTARLQGIGERVSAAPSLPAVPLVLINPGVGLPTPKVFAARQGDFSTPSGEAGVLPQGLQTPQQVAAMLRETTNDLAAPAQALLPVIGTVLESLIRSADCLLTRMSGSGATCFGLFPTTDAAAAAAALLKARHPDWWIATTALAGD